MKTGDRGYYRRGVSEGDDEDNATYCSISCSESSFEARPGVFRVRGRRHDPISICGDVSTPHGPDLMAQKAGSLKLPFCCDREAQLRTCSHAELHPELSNGYDSVKLGYH